MLVVNFSHPLTETQKAQIAAAAAQPVERVVEIRSHFDHQQPFAQQAHLLAEQVGLTSQAWQTTPLLVNPPSLSPIACVILAELHGRMGYFPPVLRLRPVAGSTPPVFEVAEIINLQAVRDAARSRR